MLVFQILNAREISVDFNKKVLDNGATIIHKYVPSSDLVAIQIRVRAGLSNEGDYAGSGISHFLEHLLFKGAHGFTSAELRKKIKAMGGVINGATGLDSAEYHIIVPNEYFEEALNLLTGLVMEPDFDDEEIERERAVIINEIRFRNDDPMTKRMQLLFSQAYREHVYKYPVIGFEENLRSLGREDLVGYHQRIYRPDRIVMGIVGGISTDRALGWASEKLESYQRGPAWTVPISPEPAQIDEREASFEAEVTLGYLAIAFHTTSLYSPELYSTDVLSILLGEGRGSRLYERLVNDKKLLLSVSAANYTPKYPGIFIITGVGRPEKIDEAREEIFRVIDELKRSGFNSEEVERAKSLVVSGFLHSHEQISSVLSSMTTSELMTGDPSFFKTYVDNINKVDAGEVQDILQKYLVREKSTTVKLMPSLYLQEKGAGGETDAESEKQAEVEEEKRYFILANGMRVIIKRRSENPIVSSTIVFPAGIRSETPENNGISYFTSSLLIKGTKRRKEDEIVPVFEQMGGSISTFSGMNSAGITMDVLSKDFDKAIDIFADCVINPVFPKEEIEKKKEKIFAFIKEQGTDIFEKGMLELRRALYGDHPYSMRVEGEIETVDKITRNDMVKFRWEHLAPNNAVMTVVGDVDIKKTVKVIQDKFENWKAKSEGLQPIEVIPPEKRRRFDVNMKKEEAFFAAGFIGLELKDERVYALTVIGSILSGSDGLLFYGLRENEGLVYTSGAYSVLGVDPGHFALFAATSEENLSKVGAEAVRVIEEVVSGAIREEDIESAKKKIITNHILSLETNSSLSMIMALDELYGLGAFYNKEYPSKIKAVTKEDVVRVAGEIFDIEKITEVFVHSRE